MGKSLSIDKVLKSPSVYVNLTTNRYYKQKILKTRDHYEIFVMLFNDNVVVPDGLWNSPRSQWNGCIAFCRSCGIRSNRSALDITVSTYSLTKGTVLLV